MKTKKILKVIGVLSLVGSLHLLNAKSLEKYNNKQNLNKTNKQTHQEYKQDSNDTAQKIVSKYRLPLSLKVYDFKKNKTNNKDFLSFDVFKKQLNDAKKSKVATPIGKIYVIRRAFLNKKYINQVLNDSKVLMDKNGFIAGRILENSFENKITSQVFNGLKQNSDNDSLNSFKDAIKIEKQKNTIKELITIALYEKRVKNNFKSLYISEFLTYNKNNSNCVKCDFTSNKDAKVEQNSVVSDTLVILKYNDRLF